MNNLQTMMSSEKMDWRTPENLLRYVRIFGHGIYLDPCTDADNPVGATKFFTEAENGLNQDWSGPGLAYANPPYGSALKLWAAKFALEGKHRELLVLVPARPDSRWFQDNITKADAICFWRGRLKFVGAKDAAPFPSAVAYWGLYVSRFREIFGKLGWIP